MGRRLERHITKQDKQMASKPMKSVVREMQIEQEPMPHL